jgi:hypothetical protein
MTNMPLVTQRLVPVKRRLVAVLDVGDIPMITLDPSDRFQDKKSNLAKAAGRTNLRKVVLMFIS